MTTSTTTTKRPRDRREHHVRRLGRRQPLGHDAARSGRACAEGVRHRTEHADTGAHARGSRSPLRVSPSRPRENCRSGSISDTAGRCRSPTPTSCTSETTSRPPSPQRPYRIASRRRPGRQGSNPPIPRPTNLSIQTRMTRTRSPRRSRIRPPQPVPTPRPHQRRMETTPIRRSPGALPRTTRHCRGQDIARRPR